MIKVRTRIKFLRRLGITLIALPEPFTTPFGVALVLLSRYLSRRREASRNKRLREMVSYYLAHTKLFSVDANSKYIDFGSVKRYAQSEEHLIPQQYTGSHSFEANLAPSVLQNWHDMRGRTVYHTTDMQSHFPHYKTGESFKVESGWSDTSSRTEKMTHHTINMKRLSQRYEGQNSAVAHSSWARTPYIGKGITPNSVNMRLLPQRYNTLNVGHTKANHTINIALLLQRYKSAMYKIALNALRHNYSYYDLVSKGNVIGGY
jgi:hypothetical protein